MSELLKVTTIAEGWLQAMEHLMECDGGKTFHLMLGISDPCALIPEFTALVDELAQEFGLSSTMENANAIWPHTLAPPSDSLEVIIDRMRKFAVPTIKMANKKHSDSYIERLVAWRSRDGGSPVPQLEQLIARITKEKAGSQKSSVYEIPIFSPGLDAGYMGFPCLSHLSFKLDCVHRLLHLTALYRNHHYIGHAYGNFVGLGRLMKFICRETGIAPGELLSVSTHADAELNRGKARIKNAMAGARVVLDKQTRAA